MQCVYFLFEGAFRDDDPNYGGHKLFSSAMVPRSEENEAYQILVQDLANEGISIIGVENRFVFDPHEVDFEDPENAPWISLYTEAVRFNQTIFTPWQLYQD
jgi:hypothetical protein